MPARDAIIATEQTPCSLATMAATRSRISTVGGFMASHPLKDLVLVDAFILLWEAVRENKLRDEYLAEVAEITADNGA
jgi:hypothetical protein